MQHVTRIAPSPTGFAHIGTFRTAYFNWLIARASGGKFILRIDDTDVERNNEAAIQPILDGLDWLGLTPDETYRQSERGSVYLLHARRLLETGKARQADNGAILLNLPDDLPTSWQDTASGRTIPITDHDRRLIDGLPLVRGGEKLGQPTYQFASVVDDYDMCVSWIVRGVDHIANTPKQIAIWTAITVEPPPLFSHVGLIFQAGKKMSKRDGAASVLALRDAGYHPEAVLNFLLRLGWGPKVDDRSSTFMNKERAVSLFLNGGAMRAANAGFDQAKLDFYNRRYS